MGTPLQIQVPDIRTAAGRQQAAALLRLREQLRNPKVLARRRLIDFTRLTYPQYIDDPAHHLIASYLDRVVRGELKRLILVAPPQHGKSELVSVRLPAFWFGKRPEDPIILSSYAASLAEAKSRRARELVDSEEFQELFPGVRLRKDSRAVDHWELAPPHRGGLKAVGVGGPVTGHGAMLGIIDDPFENWAEAQSQTIRNMVWDWFRGTFRTRIWEGGAIIIIMTRWHEDDLVGRLLGSSSGEQYEVLRLPALSETQEVRDDRNKKLNQPMGQLDPLGRSLPEQALCPRRFSVAALKEIEGDVGSQVWNAEYQGAPTAPEGNRIKRSWLPIVEALPSPEKGEAFKVVRYWDKAATEAGGAYTCGALIYCITVRKIWYIADVVRGQWEPGDRDKVILQTANLDAEKYGIGKVITYVEQEPGSGGKESAMLSVKMLAGHTIRRDPVSGSKDVRMEPFIAQAQNGNIRLLRGRWNADYIEELVAIPNGKYRDQADATSGAFNKLALAPSWMPKSMQG